ncbi:MAG: hypothetical protein J6B77_08945 [Clostridia bacterium]|nr:hypothetical protein [Clostridia bacterium]
MKTVFVNSFAKKEKVLRLHCISHKTLPNQKSDAFVFEYCGEFYLIDGGMPQATNVVTYLLELRRALLKDHPEALDDPNYKLRLNWIISHFHIDHVGAVIEKLLHHPFFAFGDIYCPPDTEIAECYQIHERDGDEKLRPVLKEALAKISDPCFRIIDIPFGKENVFTVSTESGTGREVTFTFLPPPRDLGEKWYMDYTYDLYKTEDGGIERMPVTAVNSASVWLLVRFDGRKFLFTGDTTKREKYMYSEGLELMMEAYAREIGTLDVLKFIHHGYARNHGLDAMMSFSPKILLVSKTDSKIPELKARKYPDDTHTTVLNVADETLVVTCTSQSGDRATLTYEILEEPV